MTSPAQCTPLLRPVSRSVMMRASRICPNGLHEASHILHVETVASHHQEPEFPKAPAAGSPEKLVEPRIVHLVGQECDIQLRVLWRGWRARRAAAPAHAAAAVLVRRL